MQVVTGPGRSAEQASGRSIAALVLLVAMALVGAACSADGEDAESGAPSGPDATGDSGATGDGLATSWPAGASSGSAANAAWEECLARDPEQVPPGSSYCTRIEAPLDHAGVDDRDAMVGLAVRVVKASEPDPIGPLFVNFGGPGEPVIDGVGALADALPEGISSRFDLVGMDPRGVGRSGSIECGPVPEGVDLTPTDDEFESFLLESVAYSSLCLRDTGPLLGAVGTDDVARDMDLVRETLGYEDLSYLGFSYGTLLGARYADLFPEDVRAMVLDGATDPTAPLVDRFVEMSIGRELAMDRFLEACAVDWLAQDPPRPACAFHSDGDPAGALEELYTRLNGGGDVDQELALQIYLRVTAPLQGVFYQGQTEYDALARCLAGVSDPALTSKPAVEIAQVLDDACPGGGGDAGDAGDDETPGVPPEGYSMPNPLAPNAALIAINCADYPAPTRTELEAARARLAAEAPRFGFGMAEVAGRCIAWPTMPTGTNGPITAEGLPTIVVINTTHDGATPLVTAERMAEALPDSRLIVVDGAAHASLGRDRSVYVDADDCLDPAIERYLVDLEAPPEDLRCTIGPEQLFSGPYEPPVAGG